MTGRVRVTAFRFSNFINYLVGFLALITLCAILAISLFTSIANAEPYASVERSEAALGHYARARAMLIEAIAEFEIGRRLASPDLLINPKEWRLSIISRTEELNRILDPKPRVTKSGVTFSANKRLIRKDRSDAAMKYEPQTSNIYGEVEAKIKAEAKAKAEKREAMEKEKALLPANRKDALVVKEVAPKPVVVPEDNSEEIEKEVTTIETIEAQVFVEEVQEAAASGEAVEDADIAQAIEEAIQERLEKLSETDDVRQVQQGLSE